MKTKTYLYLMLVSLLLPTSCVKDPIYEIPDAPVTVSLTASIENSTPAPEGASKWKAGDAIGLCMIEAGSATTAGKVFNYRYTAAADGADVQMLPDGDANTAYFPEDGSRVDFLAYHPYAATGPAENFSLPVDVGTQPATDLLTARADGYHRDRPAVALRFEHRLAKLIFVVKAGDGVDATQLPGARLVIRGMNTKARCLLADGSIADASAPQDIEVGLNAPGTSGIAIVLPRDAAAGVSFVVTLQDGREYTADMSDDQALTAGTQNTVTLTVNATEASMSISIAPWQKGGEEDGDAGMEIK